MMFARCLRAILCAATLISLTCGASTRMRAHAGVTPAAYMVSLSGKTSDGRQGIDLYVTPSDSTLRLLLFLSSVYPSRPNQPSYAIDTYSYEFLLPRGALRQRSGVFTLDTRGYLGRYGRLNATWVVRSLPVSSPLSASDVITCTGATAPPPTSVPATATATVALTLPGINPLTGTVREAVGAVSVFDILSLARARISGGSRTTSTSQRRDPTLRRLARGITLFSLTARQTIGTTGLSVSIDGQDAQGIAIRVDTHMTPPVHGPLVDEQHDVSDLLTTGKSDFRLGADLTATVRYHGPFGSAALRFRPTIVTSAVVPGYGSQYTDPCGKRYTVPVQPDKLITAGSAVVSGTIALRSGPVYRARLGRSDSATIKLDRLGPVVLRLLAVSPNDAAKGVSLHPSIRLTFNERPRPSAPLVYLFADDRPDPISLSTPRYDPTTHILTLSPLSPLRPQTHYTLRVYARGMIQVDANGGEGAIVGASITGFTTRP